MPLPRLIVWFFVRLAIVYGLLIAPWPGVDRAYLAHFRGMGNLLFGSFGSAGTVQFEPAPTEKGKWITQLVLKNHKSRTARLNFYKSHHAYLTTTLVIALILATPIPWWRRCKALFCGLILIHAFVVLRLLIGLLDVFSNNDPLALFTFSPFWKAALRVAVKILVISPEATFFVPIFVWVLVTLRRDDLERWGVIPAGVTPAGDRRKPVRPGRGRGGRAKRRDRSAGR